MAPAAGRAAQPAGKPEPREDGVLIEVTDAGSGLGLENKRKCSINTEHIVRVDDSPSEHPGAAIIMLSSGDLVNVEETRGEVARLMEGGKKKRSR